LQVVVLMITVVRVIIVEEVVFFVITSVVPVPDGTETQEMCPRELPLFQRFPQYSGFR
jgi:hypothetical protein